MGKGPVPARPSTGPLPGVGTLSPVNEAPSVDEAGGSPGPLEPGVTRDLTFEAPADRGRYDVICTFPGHEEAGMIGSLIVD